MMHPLKGIETKPPLHCKYYQGDTMYLPLLKFNEGKSKSNLIELALDDNLMLQKI